MDICVCVTTCLTKTLVNIQLDVTLKS